MGRRRLVSAIALMTATPPALPAQQVVELPARDRVASVELRDLYEIGGLNAPDWAAFGSRLALAFDDAGRLLVLDTDNHRLLIIGRDGRLVREIGRQGGGPGEFQLPVGVAPLPDGSVVVMDRLRRRFIRFGADGELVQDADAAVGAGMPRSIFPHPDRGVIGDAFIYTLNGQLSARTQAGMVPVEGRPIQHYPVAGDSARLLHSAHVRSPLPGPGGRAPLAAFFPEFGMTVLPDGRAVIVDSGDYRLTVVRPTGGVERVLLRPVPRPPVTERMRAAERERLLAALAEGRPPENVVTFGGNPPSRQEMEARHRQRIEGMAFPDSLPATRTLRADDEGRVWVGRYASDPHAPGPIDLISADGVYLGTIPAGRADVPLAFGPDGLAAFIVLDELDVPTIHVRRLTVRFDDDPDPGPAG